MLFKYFLIFINLITFISFINCDEHISSNKLNLIISSFQNNVLKNYEEALEFRNNGTVSRFNIFYNIKRYMMKLAKNKIERNIEKIKQAQENPSYKVDEIKLVEEINKKEKIFLKDYKKLLNIIKDTNKLYLKCIELIKKIFIISITIVIFLTILAIGIIIYLTSPRCRKYNMLINENEKDDSNNANKDDSKAYKIVKIVNSFMKSNKKVE
jgi:hypothetical protein